VTGRSCRSLKSHVLGGEGSWQSDMKLYPVVLIPVEVGFTVDRISMILPEQKVVIETVVEE